MEERIKDVYNKEIELTKEQKDCVQYTGEKPLMVRGYAGAGKSIVLMEIAQKCLAKYGKGAKNKVLLLTFQNTLVSAMRELLLINGQPEDGVSVRTVDSFIRDFYTELVKRGMVDKRNGRRFPVNDEQRLISVKEALDRHKNQYGDHKLHKENPKSWLDEFDWMKEMNVWTGDKDYYLTLPRKGRNEIICMSAEERDSVYQIFMCYCDYLNETGQGDWTDQALYIARHPRRIPEEMKFDYILIDEAQDLSLAQMKAVMQCCKTNMVVAMDMNQKIYNRYWTPELLGADITVMKLTKSMRTTIQIEALAESVRSKNDENLFEADKSLRAVPERNGEKPRIVHLNKPAAERKYVVNLVKAYMESDPNLTVGIIAAKKAQIKTYGEWLASEGMAYEQVNPKTTFSMAKPGVKVMSAFGAKGLEFDCVIIPMFVEGNFPWGYEPEDQEAKAEFLAKMRNLVYVSMTRAKSSLIITYCGDKGSRFLGEMDPDLYDLDEQE